MEILKVDVSLYKVIPFREAEPGQILEGDVFGRNDEFIAERGTEIDEQLLNKFDNFNVRRLTVREHQATWVPDDQRARLPSDAQVLREQVFEGPLEAPVRSLFGEEFEGEMLRLLEVMTDELGDREDGELLTLREDVNQLLEEVHRVRDELEDLPENTRNRVRTVLAGSVVDLGKNFLQLPGPDKQLRRYLDLFKRRDRLRRRVIEKLTARPELVPEGEYSTTNGSGAGTDRNVSRERLDRQIPDVDVHDLNPEEVSELSRAVEEILGEQRELVQDLEGIEGGEQLREVLADASEDDVLINPKTLASVTDAGDEELNERVKALIEKRQELRNRLETPPQGASETDGIEEGASETTEAASNDSASTDRIKSLLDQFDSGKRFLAVKNTVDFVRDQESQGDYVDRLKEIMRTLKDFREENQNLHERVSESARHKEDRAYLEGLMEGEKSFDPERLLEMDVDMMLVEEIETHLERRNQIQEAFEDVMWDLKTDSSVTE